MITIKPARRAGVPLVAIETSDQQQTTMNVVNDFNGKAQELCLLTWDCVRALVPLNEAGSSFAQSVDMDIMQNPVEVMKAVSGQNQTILFLHNIHLFWKNEGVLQAIWNCRDMMKSKGSMLIMLVPNADTLPPELKADVVVLEETRPTSEEIVKIVDELLVDSGVKVDAVQKAKAVDTLLGYPSGFGVEQAFAMCIHPKTGVDVKALWKNRVQTLKTLAGLEVSLPEVTYDDLAGCDGVKSFLKMYLNGKRKPRVVFLLDEIEKMVAGSGSDSSGVTQAMLEQFLYWTEAEKVDAMLLLGVPGAGKTATAKATAGEAKIPLARGSMSTVKGELVGQSEAQMKNLLKTVSTLGQGNILMLATCNSVDALPPEVQARFRLGTFFYDFPTDVENEALWNLYIKKYGLKKQVIPDSKNWVGREIESCCDRAWLFDTTLAEAAKTVVPICRANSTKMEALRRSADGRYNAASHVGVYRSEVTQAQPKPSRKFNS